MRTECENGSRLSLMILSGCEVGRRAYARAAFGSDSLAVQKRPG